MLNRHKLRRQVGRLAANCLFEGREFLRRGGARRLNRRLNGFQCRGFVARTVLDSRLDGGQLRRQRGRLARDGLLNLRKFLGLRACQRFDRLLDQRTLLLGVGNAVLHRRLDGIEFCFQAGGLALHRFFEGSEFLFNSTLQRLDGFFQQVFLGFLVGKAFLHRRLDQGEFGAQVGRLALESRFDGGKFLLHCAAQGFDRFLNQLLGRLDVGQAVGHGGFDQAELRLQARCLFLYRRLDGSKLLGHCAVQRLDGLLEQFLLGLRIGEAFLHGRFDQRELHLQTRGLRLDGRFDGRELLGHRAFHRSHGLADHFERLLAVSQAVGHRLFDRRKLVAQRRIRVVKRRKHTA